jgi:hypothetical protein
MSPSAAMIVVRRSSPYRSVISCSSVADDRARWRSGLGQDVLQVGDLGLHRGQPVDDLLDLHRGQPTQLLLRM